ncbi:TRAP transporter small permease [bacterium]|nr:TRAP transporter small permease [bacterium]
MLKFIDIVNKVVSKILIVLMAAIVLDVTWQVVTRFILRNPSSFTEELAGFLLIWIGLLGASHALYTKSHLGIDILTYKLTGVKRQIVEMAVNAFVFLFALFVMVIGGLKLVNLTLRLNQISPGIKIPMGYVYTVLPISGILMMLYAFGFILKAIKGADEASAKHQISALD